VRGDLDPLDDLDLVAWYRGDPLDDDAAVDDDLPAAAQGRSLARGDVTTDGLRALPDFDGAKRPPRPRSRPRRCRPRRIDMYRHNRPPFPGVAPPDDAYQPQNTTLSALGARGKNP